MFSFRAQKIHKIYITIVKSICLKPIHLYDILGFFVLNSNHQCLFSTLCFFIIISL